MRSALLLSFSFHIAAGLIWSMVVKISHVRFVPRQVYTVNIITPSELPKPKPKQAAVVEQPKPEQKPEKEEEEEVAPPVEKPKPPKPKPKPEKPEPKKTMPTSEPQQVEPSESPTQTGEAEEASTGDISLDGQDFPFAYYIATMRRKIAANWEVPGQSSQERYCVVYFRVSRRGSIVAPSIETSSGNLVFDQAALRAVHQANPLPALPPGYGGDDLGVHFSFAYRKE
jgi:TonB family protein